MSADAGMWAYVWPAELAGAFSVVLTYACGATWRYRRDRKRGGV